MPNKFDAVIIGGGACGLMCAVQAGLLGKKTLVLEKTDKVGAKILISGGGRCNYTNLYAGLDNFICQNEHFIRSTFQQWTTQDTITFFEKNGIKGQEKTLGQLFPTTNKAKDVVAVFEKLCQQLHQEIRTNAEVKNVIKTEDGLFEITYLQKGKENKITAPKVVMASGGLPVQKMGASDFSLRTAKSFGLQLVPTAPALVPLTISGKDAEWFASLSGNSVFAKVSNAKISFEENILFTHWGLSGPAILQISSYWKPGEEIQIDLLPNHSIEKIIDEERKQGGKRLLSQVLGDFYTKRFVEALGKFIPLDLKIASMGKKTVQELIKTIHHFTVKPGGDKGYDKAEVMRGGVNTDELNPSSLESKKIEGLFFGGECVDVTGWLGGYNFQWAWASGFVIAQHL